MPEAIFQYKCRRCGEIYGSLSTSDSVARYLMMDLINGTTSKTIGVSPTMIDIHDCGNGNQGIADIIGFITK